MSRDRIALLADGHITSDDRRRIEGLVAFLAARQEDSAAVYILGDLFEVWLGVRKGSPALAAVGRALRDLRARGVRTAYVEGNRDFHIGRGATAGLFDVVARRELVERFGERTYHLAHGDLVNRADRPYRAWRALAKGVLAPAGLALLPAGAAVRLAEGLEARLRPTNRRHKSYFPREALLEYARERIARGADVVVVGHFHHHLAAPVEAAGRQGWFVSLPFWHDEPRAVFFDRAGTMSVE